MSVEVYAAGIVALSACAPEGMDPADVEAEVNTSYPTGISSPWTLDPAPVFKTGEFNPHPCEQRTGRTHYLFKC